MNLPSLLGHLHANRDLIFACGLVGIVATLLIPLPAPVLDLLLALNISASLLLLLSALYAESPLAISSFPSILLVATLFRLALNVSSTRMILSTGRAGQVIEAFGDFVIGGTFLVGVVVFVILTIIQLVVVAKGAERVAEVSARFTLDAMPGKQLSIDADLRAGSCTQELAQVRRRALEQESQFYGALDGAMKFVKGDAIAGLIVTTVNLLGGLAAGVWVHGLSAAEAGRTFTTLSVGDGLVSQIPALLTAVAAGLVVTRVASPGHGGLGPQVFAELASGPRPLGVVAGLLGLMAFAPGMPALPFTLLALGAASASFLLSRRGPSPDPADSEEGRGAAPEARDEGLARLWICAPPSLEEAHFSLLQGEIAPALHARLCAALGVPLEPVAVRRDASVEAGTCALSLDGLRVGGVPLPSGPLLLSTQEEGAAMGLHGQPTLFEGRPALALDGPSQARARASQLPLLREEEVLTRGLLSTSAALGPRLLSMRSLQLRLDHLAQHSPSLHEALQRQLPTPLLLLIARRLLEEGVPLHQLDRAAEELCAGPAGSADSPGALPALVERARRALGHLLVHRLARGGVVGVHLLAPAWEDQLRASLFADPGGHQLALHPEDAEALREATLAALEALSHPVLLVPGVLRRPLWCLAQAWIPEISVLSFEELPREAKLRPLGQIPWGDLRPQEPGDSVSEL